MSNRKPNVRIPPEAFWRIVQELARHGIIELRTAPEPPNPALHSAREFIELGPVRLEPDHDKEPEPRPGWMVREQ